MNNTHTHGHSTLYIRFMYRYTVLMYITCTTTLRQPLLGFRYGVEKERRLKQAGAELCQAQSKLGLAKLEIFFHLIENAIYKRIEVVLHLPKKLGLSSIVLKKFISPSIYRHN